MKRTKVDNAKLFAKCRDVSTVINKKAKTTAINVNMAMRSLLLRVTQHKPI